MIDFVSYFEERGIEYWTSGRNVSKGWINITCPFCGDHAYSGNNHCGIDIKTNKFNCWVCEESGRIPKLIMELEDCSYKEAKTIIKKFRTDDEYEDDEGEPIKKSRSKIIFKEFTKDFPKRHTDYLKGRGFNPREIINKYKLYACHTIGKYKWRIIAPVYQNKKLVTFVGRDITNKAMEKYKNCPNDISIIPARSCVYNIDSVKDKIMVVEGITDVWKVGDGAVATLGKKFTKEQISIIASKNIKKAVVVYDFDAVPLGEKLADQLSGFIKTVEIVELIEMDPCDLPLGDIVKLRQMIL